MPSPGPWAVVIVLGDGVKAEREILVGRYPFRRIESARLQGRDDVTHGQVHNDRSQPAQDLATQPRHANTQSLKAFDRRHFLGEPAAHLNPCDTGEKRLEIEVSA